MEAWIERREPEPDPGTTADLWRDWPVTHQYLVIGGHR